MTMEIELAFICGRSLQVQDVLTSDPYIKFTHNGKKYKTKTISNTIDPDWKDTFNLKVSVGEKLEFECWDRDVIGKNDELGTCEWIVPEMITGDYDYFCLDNSIRGQITIKVTCLSGGKNELPSNTHQLIEMNILRVENYKYAKIKKGVGAIGTSQLEFKGEIERVVCGCCENAIPVFWAAAAASPKAKKMYIHCKPNEMLNVAFQFTRHSKEIEYEILDSVEMKIDEMDEGEKKDFTLTFPTGGIVAMELKCLKRVKKIENKEVVFGNQQQQVPQQMGYSPFGYQPQGYVPYGYGQYPPQMGYPPYGYN